MIRTTAILLALALLPLTLLAQQGQNNNLAGAIINARQKNAAMLQNYNWNSRTELDKDGNMQDIRIELVTLGPGGQPQRQMLNDQPGQLPGGFFRKRIAETSTRNCASAASVGARPSPAARHWRRLIPAKFIELNTKPASQRVGDRCKSII